MTARQGFHGLVAASAGVLALGALVLHRLVDAMGVATPLERLLGGRDAMPGVFYYSGIDRRAVALSFGGLGLLVGIAGSMGSLVPHAAPDVLPTHAPVMCHTVQEV